MRSWYNQIQSLNTIENELSEQFKDLTPDEKIKWDNAKRRLDQIKDQAAKYTQAALNSLRAYIASL